MNQKICKECNKPFKTSSLKPGVLYCSHECRKVVRSRVNKRLRDIKKQRILSGDKDYILKIKYNQYKRGAKNRGYIFALTKEEFAKHYNKPCHYCGKQVNYIGIDRMNNKIGYSIDNIVDCCTECNRFKHGFDYNEFLDKIKTIHNHLTIK